MSQTLPHISALRCGRPYASLDQAEVKDYRSGQIGSSLVIAAITKDQGFRQALMESAVIDRLNLGAISTMQISWNQPHEGNLFEFLYRRRSLEIA